MAKKNNIVSRKKNVGKLRVAVIGVGNMGRNHARLYAGNKGVELVAVVDADIKRAQEVASQYGAKALTGHKEAIKLGVDAVSVVVPTAYHAHIVDELLGAGVHVLCEKPIAKTVVEAEAIIVKAHKTKRILSIGHIERFNPAVVKLKRMIAGGELGEVKTMLFQRMGTLPPQIKEDNVVLDIGVHDVDLANHLLGSRPTKVYARGQKVFNSKREDVGDAMLIYPSATVHLQTNWITPHKVRRLMLAGTKGFVELDFISQELRLWKHNYTHEYNDFGEFVIKFGDSDGGKLIAVEKGEPLKIELEGFVDAVKKGQSAPVPADEARDALMIALALNKAMTV